MNSIRKDEFLCSFSRLVGSVYDFHARFSDSPLVAVPSDEKALDMLRGRLPLLVEELGEFAQDINKGNLEDASREIADVAFVAIGTLLALDAKGAGACREVALKNDAKTLQTHEVNATSGKLVKRT